MAVGTAFAATAEMMRPMLREFSLELCRRWHADYAGKRVPKETRRRVALRNDRIREAARAGASLDQIARDSHLTLGAVRRIIKTGDESS